MKKKARYITLEEMVRCCKKWGDISHTCEECPVHPSGCCAYAFDKIPRDKLDVEVDIPEGD